MQPRTREPIKFRGVYEQELIDHLLPRDRRQSLQLIHEQYDRDLPLNLDLLAELGGLDQDQELIRGEVNSYLLIMFFATRW